MNKIIKETYETHLNEDENLIMIQNKLSHQKSLTYQYKIFFALSCMIIASLFFFQKGNIESNNEIIINDLTVENDALLDVRVSTSIYRSLDPKEEKISEIFFKDYPFLKNIVIPEDLNNHSYYTLYDYNEKTDDCDIYFGDELVASNDTRELSLFISDINPYKPSCFIYDDAQLIEDTKESKIKNSSMKIIQKGQDENNYYHYIVFLKLEKYNIEIETNINKTELLELLTSIAQ